MLRAFILLVLAILGIFLLAVVTPWLINEQGTWGMLAMPFVWFGFFALAFGAWRKFFVSHVNNAIEVIDPKKLPLQ